MHHEKYPAGLGPGNNVGFQVKLDKEQIKVVVRGCVASDAKNDPAMDCESFEAQMIVLDHENIKEGYAPVIDCGTAHIACTWVTIKDYTDDSGKVLAVQPTFEEKDGKTTKVMKKRSSSDPAGTIPQNCAFVDMKPKAPMVVERMADYAPLGRFAVRDSKKTVAVGIVSKVEKKKAAVAGAKK